MESRTASVTRQTRETHITAELNLDGSGRVLVETGVGFFDHMLGAAMVHGYFDLTLRAEGDTHVDDHHTVEDSGIVLGQAFRQALADFAGIRRYGEASVPMDEALARAVVDLSRRPYLVFEVPITAPKVGSFDSQLAAEFWQAFTIHLGANLHVDVVRGRNMHHILEAVFKAAGRALDQATRPESRALGVTSTKGVL
ncbi:MAG: imidazoleglycerol-phosphate dehydratase HisB [Proteobacteria bacterium]|nr:imidazoleglycerol-phosphate dehydratase HisB [Pseudomonadota bacterium]